LGQSDLVISCNFDLPVETDAIPGKKNQNHAHRKKRFLSTKNDEKWYQIGWMLDIMSGVKLKSRS
jgi:hypothetical protein